MNSEKELYSKYPQQIIDSYFNKGMIFNWGDEYYDIAWQYPLISLVIIDLNKHNVNFTDVDVMVKDNILSLSYEGSNWNHKIDFPNEIINLPLIHSTINVYSALEYLHSFYEKNISNINEYFFKLTII